jgi:folylpolyglutamate synthase/dihydrofolate synthase
MLTTTSTQPQKQTDKSGKSRSYNEVVALLSILPEMAYEKESAQRVMQLDKLCGNPSQKVEIVLVGGTNGKSSTIHFASKLLEEEGYKTGTVTSGHFLSFNERISTGLQSISNKNFAETAGKVLDLASENKISATTFEVMLVTALLYFESESVKVALLEVGMGGKLDATTAFNPIIAAITRVTKGNKDEELGRDLDLVSYEMMGIAKKDTWLISAEQSKLRLQKMKAFADENEYKWAMPIRKLAPLPYIFEQLFGRTASLGERITQIYIEDIKGKFSPFLRGNLLATQRGQRGRPTLEAKRNAELNPIKTLKKFWETQFDLPRGRFEILEKEKPTMLVDNSSNLDALSNLFLGVRLLHYRHPLKGMAIIFGINSEVDSTEVLKLARYLLKRLPGELMFIPLPDVKSHNPEELVELATTMKLRASSHKSLKDALAVAKSKVDERHGIIALAGSAGVVSDYWKNVRELKKF